MAEGIQPEQQRDQEPSKEQITRYFARFGMRLRKHLKILQDPRLKVGGTEAKRAGWFINYHSVLESALALKVAELLQLGPEEKKTLLEAAMTHHAYKRIQLQREDPWSQESYTQAQQEGARILRNLGVSEQAITVNEITDSVYFKQVAKNTIDIASEESVRVLQRILALTHNSIDTRIQRSDDMPSQTSDIIFWKNHLDEVRLRNVDIADKYIAYKGEEKSYYDVEGDITAEIEAELKRKIQEKNPDSIFDDSPLALQLRALIMEDIKNDVLPKI